MATRAERRGAGAHARSNRRGLESTATSSAPALAQAAASRSAAAEVCSQGSNPRRSPATRCFDSQCSGGGSTSGSTCQALRSTCFAGLQRIAAVDEHRGFPGQHNGHAGRAGKAGQPGQPLLGGRRHIHFAADRRGESRIPSVSAAPAPRGTGPAARSARPRLRALRMSGNGLRTSCGSLLGLRRCSPQCGRQCALIWHNLCLNNAVCVRRTERFVMRPFCTMTGRLPGVSQLNDEGIHNACF